MEEKFQNKLHIIDRAKFLTGRHMSELKVFRLVKERVDAFNRAFEVCSKYHNVVGPLRDKILE